MYLRYNVDMSKSTDPKKYYSFAVKKSVYSDYLEDIPLKEISARRGVALTTLKSWIQSKNWAKKKLEIQSDSMSSIEDDYAAVIQKNQLNTLDRKLRIALLLDESVRSKLIDDNGNLKNVSPAQLKDIADAFQKNAGVDAKILGMLAPQNQMTLIAGNGAILNIGVSGQPIAPLPAPAQSKPIEVKASPAPYNQVGKFDHLPDEPF